MSSSKVEITKPRRTPEEIAENKKWTKKKLLEILDYLLCDLIELINMAATDRDANHRLYELCRHISNDPYRIRRIFNKDFIYNTNKFKLYKELFDEDEKHFKYGIDYNEWIKTGERSAHYELILKS